MVPARVLNANARSKMFPLILMESKFGKGMREWGQEMMREGVFARDEIGFRLRHRFAQGSGGPHHAPPAGRREGALVTAALIPKPPTFV